MIKSLTAKNIAVFETASLNLKNGLIAITGETGAGKSILLASFSLLRGENPERIESLKDQAKLNAKNIEVSADFLEISDEVKNVNSENSGYLNDDESLTISRVFDAETSRFKATLGSKSAPSALLQEIADELVLIHGQSDQLKLKKPAQALKLLDRFASNENELKDYQEVFSKYVALKTELENAKEKAVQDQKQLEFFRFAVQKIKEVSPEKGEDLRLKEQLLLAENATQIGQNLSQISAFSSGNDNLQTAIRSAESLANLDESFSPILKMLDEVRINLQEISSFCAEKLSEVDYNPGLIEQLHSRLNRLSTLSTWGESTDEVIEFYETAVKALEGGNEKSLETLEEEFAEVLGQLEKRAKSLSSKRRIAAQEFGFLVNEKLKLLSLPDALISIAMTEQEDFSLTGKDQVRFLFQPHASATTNELGKVASGGELSRIMLAIELVLAESDSELLSAKPTLLFDEVDSGIGGETAQIVAKMLKATAKNSQIIVVTHLASVAAAADQHFVLEKENGETTCNEVSGVAREKEIARMLSGAQSEQSLAHAKELLETTRQ